MKVTFTEYQNLAKDANGGSVPIGAGRVNSQKLTAAGNVTLAEQSQMVRIATDTAIQIRFNTAAADTDAMLPANSVEWFHCHSTNGATQTLYVILA